MSVRYFEILRDSSHKGNYIPLGRQLPRTPPLTDVKRHLDFSIESNEECEEPQQSIECQQAGSGDQDHHDQNRVIDFSIHETKTEPDEPNSMLKGMKGYELTAADLEFIKKMKEEKLIKKYQGDLEDVQRLLKKETMALELACALRDTAEAELNKFPSCEDVTEWVKTVLKTASPSADLTDLDTKSLLAMVTKENIQTAMVEKKTQLARMEKMVVNKRKKEAEERGRHEKQIASEQLKIQRLMSQLSDLTSELVQQEEMYKNLQMQIETQEEIPVNAEKVDDSEEPQAAKSQVKGGEKERKKAVKSTVKLHNATNKSNKVKSIRSKHTDSQNVVKDDHVSKSTSEMLPSSAEEQTKQESEAATKKPTKSGKAPRGPQKKVEEQELNSQHSLQAARGRRKPPGATQTAASQPKNQSKAKTGEAQSTSQQAAPSRSRKKVVVAAGVAVEEAQNAGLRRSRRIASKR